MSPGVICEICHLGQSKEAKINSFLLKPFGRLQHVNRHRMYIGSIASSQPRMICTETSDFSQTAGKAS